jgi:hypothetical protein
MRRLLSFVLPALLSFPLIAPLLLEGLDSTLPACCRKNGQHHCSMPASMTTDATTGDMSGGPAIRAGVSCCPNYPVATYPSSESMLALATNSQAVFASLVSHPAIQAQTEARRRVSFSRTRQKRGPPAFSS